MNFLAIAGGVPPFLELAVLVFVAGGFIGMVWAALVCLRKKSKKAGAMVIAIILIQGAVMQPWRSEVPYNANDADEIEDIRQGHQIRIAWWCFSGVSFALVMIAKARKRKEPNRVAGGN
jgi:hypothetical protein